MRAETFTFPGRKWQFLGYCGEERWKEHYCVHSKCCVKKKTWCGGEYRSEGKCELQTTFEFMEIYLFLFTDDKYRFYRFHCGGAIIRAAAAAVKCSLVNSRRRLRTEHVDGGHRGWWTRLRRLIWACPADGAGARALSSHPNSPLRHICSTWPHPRTAPWCLEAFVALVLQERARSWMNHTTRGQWQWRWGNANLNKKKCPWWVSSQHQRPGLNSQTSRGIFFAAKYLLWLIQTVLGEILSSCTAADENVKDVKPLN